MEFNTKSAFVALIGRPNTGKSTLLNAIMGEKIAIVSHKPQTTRNNIKGIYTTDNYQIVFTDTPGIHKPKNLLSKEMVSMAENSASDCDVCVLVCECKTPGDIEKSILEKLKKANMKCILVINKIDKIEKPALLPVIEEYSKLYDFEDIIPISATKKNGIDILKKSLEKFLVDGPFYYPEYMKSDNDEATYFCEIVREKILRQLNEEVPHGVALEPVLFEEKKGVISATINIYCEKESHKKIIIGKNGETLKRIGTYAREELEKKYHKKVFIELWVKVRTDWRNNINRIKNFGLADM